MLSYFCRKCSQEFTYRSGLINLLLCSDCAWEEVKAVNDAEHQRNKAIMEHEKALYGEDVYIAYALSDIRNLLASHTKG